MVSEHSQIAEFSRPVEISRLGDAETVHDIEASPVERAALAQRFGLLALDSLSATVRLRRVRGGAAIRLSGRLTADVTQACVVSLAPVEDHVEDEFTVLYADSGPADETAIGADADVELPEPLPAGPLDIGEAVAQQLSLALDPYPRAPGVEVDRKWSETREGRENRFARLAALRKIPRSSGQA